VVGGHFIASVNVFTAPVIASVKDTGLGFFGVSHICCHAFQLAAGMPNT